jgi:tetratricopeptide (TPR) repeat protein
MIEFASDAEGQVRQVRAERAARGEKPLPPVEEWTVSAHRLEAAGYPRGAADAWRKALAEAPALPQAHLGLGRALLALGDGEGAANAALAALDSHATAAERGVEALLDDPDEDPWFLLGQAQHLRGRFPEAIAAYARSVQSFPWFAEPLVEMARAEMARGGWAKAADAAKRALLVLKWKPDMARDVQAILDEANRKL